MQGKSIISQSASQCKINGTTDMVLVTGATGLVGSHLLYKLLQSATPVVALYRENSNRAFVKEVFAHYTPASEELYEKIIWRKADLMDLPALELAMEGIREVYHCAAMVSFNPRDAKKMLHINPLTTANVVNACLAMEVRKLVYVSSVAALGRSGAHGMISEETDWTESKHNSAYARSKYKAELEVWRGSQEGLSTAIVNPGIIMGPGNWEEGSPTLFKRIAEGFKYYTLGTNGFVDVRDVVDVMVTLMSSDIEKERFLLVGENLSYKKVFEFIAKGLQLAPPSKEARTWQSDILWRLEKVRTTLFGGKPLITQETARSANSTYYYENAKVREKLGFEFRKLADSIPEIARMYRKKKSA